jgi:hypothetical protein
MKRRKKKHFGKPYMDFCIYPHFSHVFHKGYAFFKKLMIEKRERGRRRRGGEREKKERGARGERRGVRLEERR